jgi:hypothetical protein
MLAAASAHASTNATEWREGVIGSRGYDASHEHGRCNASDER